MKSFADIFKAYDVRGVVPDQFDAEMAACIGAAFGHFVTTSEPDTTSVIVGRDMRESGVAMSEAFANGVMSQGLNVIDVGLASTDLVYFASGSMSLPGVIFTASHNPAQYNGIKFCLSGAKPVGQDTGLSALCELATEGLSPVATTGERREVDLLSEFVAHVVGFVDVDRLTPLSVVADTANGMGGLVVPAVFESLPFTLDLMYGELDGTFPNHPADPLNADNQVDLIKRVVDLRADVGLAFDGDADRVFLVDENGVGLSGSTTTAILSDAIVRKNGGGKVVHNLICSRAVPEIVSEAGGTPIRSRVGHSFIKEIMADEDAIFGGEHSAHYYFADNFRADSGLIAAVLVLEQMCIRAIPLSELRLPYERYSASGEINTTVDDAQAAIERVSEHFSDCSQDRLDGLTVDGGDWWFNLRASNTEPLLRLNLEAPTPQDVETHTARVRGLLT